jgi:hypothetical protein
MGLAPFCLLASLIISDGHLDFTEHLRGQFAHGCAKGICCRASVEIGDGKEVLWPKEIVRFNAASGIKHIGDADRCCAAEGHSYVKFIITLQNAFLNDAEELFPVVAPMLCSKLSCHLMELIF